jgi:glycosyltransferase involved in cell wall biosynthesis
MLQPTVSTNDNPRVKYMNKSIPSGFTFTMLGSMPPIGGISAYCLEICRALASNSQLEFISFKRMYPKALHPGGAVEDHSMPRINSINLRIHRRMTWYNPISWLIQGALAKGELLHVQWWSWVLAPPFAVIMTFFRLRRKPIVTTIHNVRPHEDSLFSSAARRLIFALSDHFIVHSTRNKKDMHHYFQIPKHRISVIPHGLLSFPSDAGLHKRDAKSAIGLNPRNQTILCFGAIRPYKGIDILIEAASILTSDLPRLRIMIVGQPWEDWQPYQDRINTLGLMNRMFLKLDFIKSNEVSRYFQAADLVVLPYRHFHAQTGVGLIALSLGKALIVSDVGGLPDLVSNNNYVVPPGDTTSLAHIIRRIFTTPEMLYKMERGSKRLAADFKWGNIANKTQAIYRMLYENHS